MRIHQRQTLITIQKGSPLAADSGGSVGPGADSPSPHKHKRRLRNHPQPPFRFKLYYVLRGMLCPAGGVYGLVSMPSWFATRFSAQPAAII